MYKVVFYMFFGAVYAEENGKHMEWNNRKDAESWARANCGPNSYEAIEVKP